MSDWRAWPKRTWLEKFQREDSQFSAAVSNWQSNQVTQRFLQMLEKEHLKLLWELVGTAAAGSEKHITKSLSDRLDLLGALIEFFKEPLEKANKEKS